jgi:very-short-patch-repair endonuclease
VDPVAALVELGGVARTEQLLVQCSPRAISRASTSGQIIRVGRGRYRLASANEAAAAAARLYGTLSHLSAAQHHGWEIARDPDRPWIAVPRNRKISPSHRRGVHLSYSDARGTATDPIQTVLDCARRLPFGEALTVADSALRHGLDPVRLHTAAGTARGPGSGQCRRVALAASPLAANPLESCLRAIALEVPGLQVRPQVPIELPGVLVHPDLVDTELGIVIEAEGWLFHGASAETFARDLWRYTMLVARGWLVVRFGYRQVMDQPEYVFEALALLVQTGRSLPKCLTSGVAR